MKSWYASMDEFADAGYRVLAFDGRGVGDSTGDASTDPADRAADIEAALPHARETGATQVVVMGSSLGAQAALLVAEANDVAAVVGVSPATIPEGLERITVPAFFVAAEGDTGSGGERPCARAGTWAARPRSSRARCTAPTCSPTSRPRPARWCSS